MYDSQPVYTGVKQGSQTFLNIKFKDFLMTFQAHFPQIQEPNTTWFKTPIKVDYCYNTENFCNEFSPSTKQTFKDFKDT